MSAAYRTTPTSALQVINGVAPLHIKAAINFQGREELRAAKVEGGVKPSENCHPADRGDTSVVEFIEDQQGVHEPADILVDASSREGRVGIAALHRIQDTCQLIFNARLADGTPSHLAELTAVLDATLWAIDNVNGRRVVIDTDSKYTTDSVTSFTINSKELLELYRLLRANRHVKVRWTRSHLGSHDKEWVDREAKQATRLPRPRYTRKTVKEVKRRHQAKVEQAWQAEWDRGDKGRSTHSVIPWVSNRYYSLGPEITQAITGHGEFNQYFHRFRLKNCPAECECGNGPDNSEHVLFGCALHRRVQARRKYLGMDTALMLVAPDTSGPEIERVNSFGKEIVYDYAEPE